MPRSTAAWDTVSSRGPADTAPSPTLDARPAQVSSSTINRTWPQVGGPLGEHLERRGGADRGMVHPGCRTGRHAMPTRGRVSPPLISQLTEGGAFRRFCLLTRQSSAGGVAVCSSSAPTNVPPRPTGTFVRVQPGTAGSAAAPILSITLQAWTACTRASPGPCARARRAPRDSQARRRGRESLRREAPLSVIACPACRTNGCALCLASRVN